jgi:hypothetical protein
MAVFAIIFSALIHDADHRGVVSNTQLIKEDEDLAAVRGQECGRTKFLGHCMGYSNDGGILPSASIYIFGTQAEFMRSRQLIVNVVLATDIFDKELNGKCVGTVPFQWLNLETMPMTCERQLSWNTLFKRPMFPMPCNIGTYIKMGTDVCSRSCTLPIASVGWLQIHIILVLQG